MQINSNRSVKLLSLSLSLIAAGCSQPSKDSLSAYDTPPQVSSEDHSFFERFSYRSHNKSKLSNRQYETVWDRLVSLYALPEIDNARVDREIEWYLQHPQSLISLQQRAEPYMHHILDEVEAKHIPGELALLPVVESSFVPNAYSKSAASGLWQFIPSTGQEFGLKQNTWYDGRRDVYASTQAATTYLKQLSETFNGDWLLALASYNYGKGNVRKCIERNEDNDLPTDYWSLSLPDETYHYVPKLLAVAKIFANAERYHIPLRHIPNKPYFEVVDIKAPLDLSKAAQMANTPLNEFLKLNPGFNRWCTAPDGPHRLLIPVKNAPLFKKNLAEIPYYERVNYSKLIAEQEEQIIAEENYHKPEPVVIKQAVARTSSAPSATGFANYQVKRGDTLTSIAQRNHTTVQSLRSANHLAKNSVNYGAVLQIPSAAKQSAKSIILAKSSNSPGGYHTVQKGDTFFNIARRYSVNPKELADWNRITLKTALVPGRKLMIKGREQQVASSSNSLRLIHYTVRKGDTLTQLSKKFNISASELRKSNSDTLARGLQPGQKLKILVDSNRSTI
ncbi:LysM peptidoglycan-binding domain-containing protein [Methylomicrobium sp. Wu6]|uniref:lytic transglycosylase n=1 Tax=Methylomicrobium sp. Wu6 TaxID=3107928 RepID=UPI002DD67D72|nr:LysM peptidoglycan-binding domain-containing protein [Methylomicrobium sp. Wu6]MEC4749508.1 LysM peptidoglycan-binding domain-containing protein [Methylomicrobium sp. Wu6]